ncbi:MAG: sn-glycerol-3-phosphate ABC transporter ATP-binding protein UgpC [Granulosicoccus sp.]|nr:sn-glycerol-3-phosphate ABC transporter ATP-binding protein UgpC [Granulosicoccus sp.]
MAEVELRKAYKRFGDAEVIHGVDMKLPSGEFIVFVGPSGCGKSTLLRMIAGLEELSDGSVHIKGRDVTNVEAVDRGIAMVFQSYALYPHMSVEENMGFGLRMGGAPKEEVARKVADAAKTLQLDQLLERKPKNLSGGQRQRVAIGRAIVRNPDVFLFDEPLSNLDAELRVEMRLRIAQLHNQLDATMIYVTHDQVEAMTMADKIVVLRDGYVEQIGSPLELYHHPDNLFVAGFIGSPKMNFIEVTVREGGAQDAVIELDGGITARLPVNASRAVAGSKATMGIRPEDAGAASGDFQLPIKVDVAERLGGSTFLYGQCAGLENFVVQRPGIESAKHGDTINLAVSAKTCYLFDDDGLAYHRNTPLGKQSAA